MIKKLSLLCSLLGMHALHAHATGVPHVHVNEAQTSLLSWLALGAVFALLGLSLATRLVRPARRLQPF